MGIAFKGTNGPRYHNGKFQWPALSSPAPRAQASFAQHAEVMRDVMEEILIESGTISMQAHQEEGERESSADSDSEISEEVPPIEDSQRGEDRPGGAIQVILGD